MKLFAALCAFAAVSFATDPTDELEDRGNDTWEDIKSWASDRQEPVEFQSILSGNPCLLKGSYGWFKKIGTSNVTISETVYGCEIVDGSSVLTWAVIENPEEAGM